METRCLIGRQRMAIPFRFPDKCCSCLAADPNQWHTATAGSPTIAVSIRVPLCSACGGRSERANRRAWKPAAVAYLGFLVAFAVFVGQASSGDWTVLRNALLAIIFLAALPSLLVQRIAFAVYGGQDRYCEFDGHRVMFVNKKYQALFAAMNKPE